VRESTRPVTETMKECLREQEGRERDRKILHTNIPLVSSVFELPCYFFFYEPSDL